MHGSDQSNQVAAPNPSPQPTPPSLAEVASDLVSSSPGASVPLDAEKLPIGLPHSGADAQEFACHIHSYLREYIDFSDRKASFVFAVDAAILIYMYQKGFQSTWLKPFATWLASDLFIFVAMLLLFGGCVLCGAVVLPRFFNSHRGFVYFGSISEFESATDYSKTIFKQERLGLTEAILKHNFDLAKICVKKFRVLSYGVWFSVFGVLVAIAVLVLTSPSVSRPLPVG